MTDDNVKILEAITDLTKTVETYHGDFREFRGEIKTKVDSLEDDAKSTRLWQKIQMACVVPVIGALHQIAQHFHWIK
jgi:hypothetical protein